MKFVATKTADQLDLQALHRVRERLVQPARTGIINQIRAFLLDAWHCGAARGQRFLARRAAAHPRHATRCSCRPVWCGSSRTWLATGAGSTSGSRGLSKGEIEAVARQDADCEAVDERAGDRPDHLQCDGGRDRPRRSVREGTRLRCLAGARSQADIDAGDRTILGKISKRGNRYLRRPVSCRRPGSC